ncbi:MAG: hypothetical protein GXY89_01630 [Tissierellia bacterium]|nr:hypothetical protein [Tissierellia bacterium]
MSKNRVQVEIDGITFNVVSADDGRYINYVTSQVNRAIKDTVKANPKLTKTEGIILVAVNLQDQLEKEKKKLEDFKISIKNDENAKKLQRFEQTQKELENLKQLKIENENLIEKYKKAENFSSNKLKEETDKYKKAFNEVAKKNKELDDAKKEIDVLKNKLSNQERLNFDRNKDIINLKGTIRNLKEEIAKLEKRN